MQFTICIMKYFKYFIDLLGCVLIKSQKVKSQSHVFYFPCGLDTKAVS